MRVIKKIPGTCLIVIVLLLFISTFSSAQNQGNEDTSIPHDNGSASLLPDNADDSKKNSPDYVITIGTEIMDGNTTYQIGYPFTEPDGTTYIGYFPFSELQWPLDIFLIKIEASVNIGKTWQINARFKKNLDDPDGKMKDSDWITSSDPSRLDVYSESEISKFDALIFDIDAEWTFFKKQEWSVYTGLGFQYQKFEYSAKLIRQYSPSGLSGYDAYGDGRVGITYEIMYSIPYIIIGSCYEINENITIDGSLAFSLIAQAEDEDNHLLRENGGKISKGSMDGSAYIIDISAEYDFNRSWFLDGGIQYTKIKVKGDQKQIYGDGEKIGTICEKSESSQTSIYISAGYKI